MIAQSMSCPKKLPDVQSIKGQDVPLALSWVGMEQIDLPIDIVGRPLAAKVNAGINLLASPEAEKGIHMSRLYLLLDRLTQAEVTPKLLQQILSDFLATHSGRSDFASIEIVGDLLLSRKSLVSNHAGWKAYPLRVRAQWDTALTITLRVGIPYSSTCPASTALSQQLAKQQFELDFAEHPAPLQMAEITTWLSEKGIPATPHSQRSWAWVEISVPADIAVLPVIDLIESSEMALATAVQTAVKRSDEQAFALINGQNLMFCEDAARRLNDALEQASFCHAFKIRVEHQESLHAHNAVARIQWKESRYAP